VKVFAMVNDTVVVVAGLGECGLGEHMESLIDHCMETGRCSRLEIINNIKTKVFQIVNALLEIFAGAQLLIEPETVN
jgi:hypothetical protein